ncbi:MAG: phosphoglucosamine mutase [Saprospiraceae bacterium]
MSLIVSVSGIRGTIGGYEGKNLTPLDLVKFASAYSIWLKKYNTNPTIVIGRDGRLSGLMVSDLIVSTMIAMGVNVIDVGLSTTPSVEMQVILKNLDGGIILTASHNPREWNALKLLNNKGEFLSSEDGKEILSIKEAENYNYSPIDNLGKVTIDSDSIREHINSILNLELVSVEKIRQRQFHIIADVINSTGAIALPMLFESLNCSYELINEELSGNFAHNPEPLEANLVELIEKSKSADLGIAVDPDVDRLALVDENGNYFGEEYTLVSVSDYVLSKNSGNTVSNLSSSRALKDLTESYFQNYYASAVGEAHVVKKMKEVNAVIGGEGNGGVIYPPLHYGRDSLVGIALLLSLMAESNLPLSKLKEKYSKYEMYKDKIQLDENINYNNIVDLLTKEYVDENIDLTDGMKIDFKDSWVQLRKSNTEPIIRIYSEAKSLEEAEKLVLDIKKIISKQ